VTEKVKEDLWKAKEYVEDIEKILQIAL